MHLRPEERDALQTTSFGTGQLLRAARDAGCRRVLLCVGGSATVDGGAGCLQALGWRFADHAGELISELLRGGMLSLIATIQPPAKPPSLDIDILCDVNNPLLGARGAAAVFGPQKGATPAGVRQLERGLAHWATLLVRAGYTDAHTQPGSGAAGGLPAGLAAALGAKLRSGFDEVARWVGLEDRLRGCDLCLTGEGRIDEQTTHGKVVAGVARLAAARGVRVWAFAGAVRSAGPTEAELALQMGLAHIFVITPRELLLPEALARTAENLRRTAREALLRS
jgi:glycerate kinase